MGKGERGAVKASAQPSLDLMYEHGQEEDEFSEGLNEDEHEDDESYELPTGYAGPAGRGHIGTSKQGSSKKGSGSSGKKDKKGSTSPVARQATRDEFAEALEGHEVFQKQSSSSGGSGGVSVEDIEEEDDREGAARNSGWRKYLSVEGLGGGAMSSAVIASLLAPAVAINLLPGVSYAKFGQFLFVPLLVYVYLSVPVFLGAALAWGLRFLGPLNGYPFRVGSIKLSPWIKDWHLFVRLEVLDAAFGNPPGFPFEDFVSAKRLDMEASVPFAHLWNLLTLRKERVPLARVPDFERFIKFDFNHVEVEDVMCNFQMFDGKFNIAEFTRILADGEVRHALPRGAPAPNQLSVRVLRAKNLAPAGLKKTADPYVVVRARRQALSTHTQNHTLNPMWNEELVLNVEDASVVLEVAVYDRDAPEGNQAHMIGHWIMTSKWLVTNPKFCWRADNDEFVAYSAGRPAPGGGFGFRGWVPLATRKWKKMGLCGELELEVIWKHVPEGKLVNKYVPARRYTALEQLQTQSAEDQLKFGDWARFRDWLSNVPFSYDIRRFTVRGTRFYLQDLFRGHKGKPETLVKSGSGAADADCIKLPLLEMRKQFRPKGGDEGITTYDVFTGFFIGLIASGARSGRLGGAVAQILSGGMFNFGYKFKSLLTGHLDRALLPIRGKQLAGVAQLAKTGFAVVHQNVTQTRRNKAQFKVAVEAEDEDFLQDKVALAGHLDRCAVKVKGDTSDAAVAAIAARRGEFKTKYFELKGETFFYRKHKTVPKGVTYNLTYKLCLEDIFSAVYVKEQGELLLNMQDEAHIVRLRDPHGPDAEGGASIKDWVKVLTERAVNVTTV